MHNLIKKAKANDSKIFRGILITFALTSLFISALTFNFIGHGIYDGNLVSGFVLSIISFIASITIVVINNKTQKLNLVFWCITFTIVLLSILGIIFGTMGYIGHS